MLTSCLHKLTISLLSAIIIMWLSVSVWSDVDPSNENIRYKVIYGLTNKQLYDLGMKHSISNPDSALLYFDVLINRCQPSMDIEDTRRCAEAMFNSGKIYYEHFNYISTMEILLKCRKLCETYDFKDILSDTYRYIGNINSIHADYDRAIESYNQALTLAKEAGSKDRIHNTLNNLVGAYVFLNNREKAQEYYGQLCALNSDNYSHKYDVLFDGALISIVNDDISDALKMLFQAAAYSRENNMDASKRGMPNSWLANIYMSQGKADSALYYLHLNENLARESRQTDLLVETLRGLAEIYKQLGRQDRSFEYLEEYLSLSDSVFNQKVFNNLKNAQFQWELSKNENIIQDLNQQHHLQSIYISQQRVILWIVSVCALLLIVLLVIIYRQKHRISMAYNDLFERNQANLEQEKIYRARIRELQEESVAKSTENFENQVTLPSISPLHDEASEPATKDIPISPEVRQRLLRDIGRVLDKTEFFCDPSFTINRLADEVRSNTTYVSKIINETYGMSFRSFLGEYRIKEAMARISDNTKYANYTIKAIAESVGFKSQSAFITAFTKFTGMKPSMYQEIARHKNNA